MTAPSPDLQEALRRANLCRPFPDPSVRERDFLILADEVDRLRAELAEETKHRLVLAATLESDWAEQCNAMGAVVRAAERWARADITSEDGGTQTLLNAVDVFIASGFADDILTEDRT